MLEDHIHALEQKLRESEKERYRYQNEANRIKEMMQRNAMSTRHAAQIGKFTFTCLSLLVFQLGTNYNSSTSPSLQQNQSEPVSLVMSTGPQ